MTCTFSRVVSVCSLLLFLLCCDETSSSSHLATSLHLLSSSPHATTGAPTATKKTRTSWREKLTILKGEGKVYVCRGSEALELRAVAAKDATNVYRKDKYQISKCKSRSIQRNRNTNNDDLIEIDADAIFGIFELPLGSFLGVITSSVPSPLVGEGVREVQEIDLVQITEINRKDKNYRSKKEEQKEAVSMLTDAFSVHSLYFSTGDYDITRNIQGNIQRGYRMMMSKKKTTTISTDQSQAYLQADEKFFWNLNVSMPFIERNFGDWITPFANIWTETKSFTQDNRKFNLTLISRRGSRRQGPRYIKRGVDKNGDVANFVETEQILRSLEGIGGSGCGELFAFTQIRGSIPLYWEQLETWRLKPVITPDLNLSSQYIPLRTHISAICSDYCDDYEDQDKVNQEKNGMISTNDNKHQTPDMVFVNLIDKKGMQGALGACLSKALKGLQKNSKRNINIDNEKKLLDRNVTTVEVSKIHTSLIEHIWFDYHNKCAGGKTSSLGELIPLLDPISIGTNGYLHMNRHGKVLKKQKKIIRTNCIDCLDRTNVMQSNIARRVLQHQLSIVSKEPFHKSKSASSFSLSSSSRNRGVAQNEDYAKYIPPFREKSLELLFREIWGDNGDNLSMLYAGTRALKRDVTRKGKRTRQGVFDDGVNSAKRYFINNFKDPRYQRALDIILGGDVDDTSSEKLGKLRQALRFKKVPGSVVTDRYLSKDESTRKETSKLKNKINTVQGVSTKIDNTSTINMIAENNINNNTIEEVGSHNTSIISSNAENATTDFDPKEMRHKTMAVGKKKRGEPEDQISNFKEQIADFYEKYNPSKIADIPNILEKYKGNEKKLLDNLRLKYMTTSSDDDNNVREKKDSSDKDVVKDVDNKSKGEEKHTRVRKVSGNVIKTAKNANISKDDETTTSTTISDISKDMKSNLIKKGNEMIAKKMSDDINATADISVNQDKLQRGKTTTVLRSNSKITMQLGDTHNAISRKNDISNKEHQRKKYSPSAKTGDDESRSEVDSTSQKWKSLSPSSTVVAEEIDGSKQIKNDTNVLEAIDDLFGGLLHHWEENV